MKFSHIFLTFFFMNDLHCVSSMPFLFRNFFLTNHYKSLALEFHSYLNTTANSCDNFYNFACGGWISKNQKPPYEITWNNFRVVANRINGRLKAILEDEQNSMSMSLRKAQIAYRACTIETNFLGSLRLLIRAFGGWSSSTTKFLNQTKRGWWLIDVVKAIIITESYPIVKMHIGVDIQNNSQHILYIDPGELNVPSFILIDPTAHDNILSKYKQWILQTIKYVYANEKFADLNNTVEKMINFEIKLAKISSLQNKRQKVSIKQLSITTGINWKRIINMLFTGTGICLINEDLILYSPTYLQSLIFLLDEVHPKEILINYITWSIIRNLSRDTSQYMRKLNFKMDKAVFSVQSDMPRSYECVSKINKYLGSNLIAKYIEKYLKSGVIQQAKEMAEGIKMEYIEMLVQNKWLSPEIRKLVIEKILAVKFLIGFPRWMANGTLVDNLNQDVTISDNHFVNILNLKQLSVKRELSKLIKPPNKNWWPIDSLEPNGFYYILQNSIVLPLSMLEPPFFDVDRPVVFNYGALGSLIGHEISHALDTIGRQSDKNGNIRNWWHEEDVNAYKLKAECFIKKYAKYEVDNSYTIDENIADNVGILLSYHSLKRRNLHMSLPYLKSYTDDQLFFIAFSQLWCEIPDNSYNMLQDEHAPVYVRVTGTLSNSREFQKSFGCLNTDINYCKLW